MPVRRYTDGGLAGQGLHAVRGRLHPRWRQPALVTECRPVLARLRAKRRIFADELSAGCSIGDENLRLSSSVWWQRGLHPRWLPRPPGLHAIGAHCCTRYACRARGPAVDTAKVAECPKRSPGGIAAGLGASPERRVPDAEGAPCEPAVRRPVVMPGTPQAWPYRGQELPGPGLGCRWRSVGGERARPAGPGTAPSPDPADPFLSQARRRQVSGCRDAAGSAPGFGLESWC